MAKAKREYEGDLFAFLVRMIPYGVWAAKELVAVKDLNPFRSARPDSPAMQAHKERLKAMKWKAMTNAS